MWRVTPGQALRLRQFDDGCVLYNDLAGDTHLLGDDAIEILSMLQQGPACTAQLCQGLAGAMDCPCDAAFAAGVDALLMQLSTYFLIETMP